MKAARCEGIHCTSKHRKGKKQKVRVNEKELELTDYTKVLISNDVRCLLRTLAQTPAHIGEKRKIQASNLLFIIISRVYHVIYQRITSSINTYI